MLDLDMLDAEILGADPGDAYLRAHPEIARGPNGRPLRGMLLPLSEQEKADWIKELGTTPPATAYQSPSADELKKRDPAGLNEAERYWIATIEGSQAEIAALKQVAEAQLQRDLARIDARVAKAEGEVEGMRKLDDIDGPFGSLGKAVRYLPWIVGGVVAVGVGVPLLTGLIPALIPARRLLP